MDDQAAVRRLKRGDINGLEALVARYQVEAARTAYLIVRDAALADDVMQEAFLRAYRHIGSFDASRPFAPWFIRIVVNLAVHAAERESRAVSLNGQSDDGDEASDLPGTSEGEPETAIEWAELRERINAALESLSAKQRAVIVLRYYHDLSEQDIAQALNIPAGTVGWRLHAARQRLGALLRMQGLDHEPRDEHHGR